MQIEVLKKSYTKVKQKETKIDKEAKKNHEN